MKAKVNSDVKMALANLLRGGGAPIRFTTAADRALGTMKKGFIHQIGLYQAGGAEVRSAGGTVIKVSNWHNRNVVVIGKYVRTVTGGDLIVDYNVMTRHEFASMITRAMTSAGFTRAQVGDFVRSLQSVQSIRSRY